ncbi:MAG TPA: extracellular solute-binding protein [Candidatus Methylomirabilis sp.]|nr:extracellular solute-binding protein [Candidatus Methylomirabilis sp.]
MDHRLRDLADRLDAGLIARREFLRKAAVITGGTAAGLDALRTMAAAQPKTKLRVWLFKSFVTAGNDVVAKQVEAWAKEKNVEVETDWATFGDREQKFVAAIEAGNPPDMAEMNLYGPMRYKAALRDVSGVASQLAQAKGGMLPFAERITKVDGKFLGVPRYAMIGVFFIRRDIMETKGLKPPKVYDPDVIEFARKTQDLSKELYGFGQTLNRSDDGDGFMQAILWDYGGGAWDKDGKPALGTTFKDQNLKALQFAVDTIQKYKIQPPGVMGWTDPSNNEAYMAGKLVTTNNGASLYYAMVSKKHDLAAKTLLVLTPGGPAGSFAGSSCYNWGIFSKSKHADLCEDLIRWMEDEKRFAEYVSVSVGQAGPVYKGRVDNPYWKSDPNFDAIVQNILRSVPVGYPGPITSAAVEVQAQHILTDMAGRVVSGGLSPEAALKEAHARVEEISKVRRT